MRLPHSTVLLGFYRLAEGFVEKNTLLLPLFKMSGVALWRFNPTEDIGVHVLMNIMAS